MPVLPNNKHVLFAHGLAKGLSADAANEQASYRPNRGNAVRLKANESVSGRVKELQEDAADKVVLTKQ
jgi:phage terminase small subunit